MKVLRIRSVLMKERVLMGTDETVGKYGFYYTTLPSVVLFLLTL